MKEYMMIIWSDTQKFLKQPETNESQSEAMAMIARYLEDLAKKGLLLGAQPLGPEGRVVDNSLSVSEGPYLEGKEFVGGYFLVKAKNIDEAVELAKANPLAKTHKIEVRAIAQLGA